MKQAPPATLALTAGVSRSSENFPPCFVILLLAGALGLLCGCTTRGVANSRGNATLPAARSMDLTTRWSGQLAVLLQADHPGITGAILLGIAGAAIEKSIRAGIDARSAETLRERVGPYDLRAKTEGRLLEVLRESGRFETVTASEARGDARLELTLEHGGLLPSFRRGGPSDLVQVGIHYKARLLAGESRSTVWEIKDICFHGDEHPLSEFLARPELVRTGLDGTAEQLAHRLSNAIRLAVQPAP